MTSLRQDGWHSIRQTGCAPFWLGVTATSASIRDAILLGSLAGPGHDAPVPSHGTALQGRPGRRACWIVPGVLLLVPGGRNRAPGGWRGVVGGVARGGLHRRVTSTRRQRIEQEGTTGPSRSMLPCPHRQHRADALGLYAWLFPAAHIGTGEQMMAGAGAHGVRVGREQAVTHGGVRHLRVFVRGLNCPSTGIAVEKALCRVPGVVRAVVNPVTQVVCVDQHPEMESTQLILSVLRRFGLTVESSARQDDQR